MANPLRAALVEYSLTLPPLALVFDFSPQSITRGRSISIRTGGSPATRGGYDFRTPMETVRAAQGVEMQAETFSVDVMFDASDRIAEGDDIAARVGVQPELDTLRTMVEPKTQGPDGYATLASLGAGGERAFQRDETPSVLLFVWGVQVLPVFLTSVSRKEVQHLPNLMPYRAEVSLSMQVIESNNPFYQADKVRQVAMAGLNGMNGFGGLW
jgi:hypothetical protein